MIVTLPPIHQLRVSATYDPDIIRVLEIPAASSLQDLATTIAKSFDLTPCAFHQFSMFPWSRLWEHGFGGDETDAPRRTSSTVLGDPDLEPGRRFQYLHDGGNIHWYWVDVVSGVGAEPGVEYPRVVMEQGRPTDFQALAGRKPATPPVLDGIQDLIEAVRFIGEGQSAPRGKKRGQVQPENDLLLEYHVAMRIHEWATPDPRRFDKLENRVRFDLMLWLLDLPFRLSEKKFINEASEISFAFGELLGPENFLGDRPVWLATAGEHDASRRQIEYNKMKFPDDPWVAIKAGDALQTIGEAGRAEELFRTGLGLAEGHRYTIEGALERLVPLLEEQGRTEEAAALEAEVLEKMTPPGHRRDEASVLNVGTVRRDGAKTGRNDPCPCGSGRKFKKCCGK